MNALRPVLCAVHVIFSKIQSHFFYHFKTFHFTSIILYYIIRFQSELKKKSEKWLVCSSYARICPLAWKRYMFHESVGFTKKHWKPKKRCDVGKKENNNHKKLRSLPDLSMRRHIADFSFSFPQRNQDNLQDTKSLSLSFIHPGISNLSCLFRQMNSSTTKRPKYTKLTSP